MFRSFDISFLVPGMAFTGSSLESHSLGGPERAAVHMARALVTHGARVAVFCNTPGSADHLGVRYESLSGWNAYVRDTPHDVSVVQRSPEAFSQQTRSRLNLLWCHDVAMGRQKRAFKGALWNIDRIFVLSAYMREQYKAVFELDDDLLVQTRNGVDLGAFDAVAAESIARDPSAVVFAGRPEQGLDLLLGEVFPRLLTSRPDLRLYLASYGDEYIGRSDLSDKCSALAAALGEHVVPLGALAPADLYRRLLSARLYLYPTPSSSFATLRETSCIAAMECQAAGLPIVTSRLGAIPEAIAAGAGYVIDGDPTVKGEREQYLDSFCSHALELLIDDEAWLRAHKAGVAHSQDLSWRAVAGQWLDVFETVIRSNNDSRERLRLHFARSSDRVGARFVTDDVSGDGIGLHRTPESSQRASSSGRALQAPASAACDLSTNRPTIEDDDPRFVLTVQWLGTRMAPDSRVLVVGPFSDDFAERLTALLPEMVFFSRTVTSDAASRSEEFDGVVLHGEWG